MIDGITNNLNPCGAPGIPGPHVTDIKLVDKVANATKAVGKTVSKMLKGDKKEEPKK